MSATAAHQLLDRIQRLSTEDRMLLDELLANLEKEERQREADSARSLARERGLDQEAIDRAVSSVRPW